VRRRYWDATAAFRNAALPTPEAEASDALWRLLRDAVRSHLISDVPVGAFLSGGVDSSTVVAIMAAEIGVPVKTFSVGFQEPDFSERSEERRVGKEGRWWRWAEYRKKKVMRRREIEVVTRA